MSRGERTPLLIVGCRRSGTTLLRTILEGHPDLLVHPDEPQFFLELYRDHGFSNISAEVAIEHILNHPYALPGIKPDLSSSSQSVVSLRAIAEHYMEAWITKHPGKRPVLKHPALVFHLEMVDRIFPDSIVMNIVRDPRANVSSQRLRWPQFPIWTCAEHWKQAVRAATWWGERHPRRYILLSYENLVRHPRATVKRLCRSLSLQYSDQLLTFRHMQTVFEPNTGPRIKQFTGPDASRLQLWRRRLASEEIQLVEICCGDEMNRFGYKPVCKKPASLKLNLRILGARVAHSRYQVIASIKDRLRSWIPSTLIRRSS